MRILLALPVLIALSSPAARPLDLRMIEYDIDGTAKYVDVTWNNSVGATEQKRLKLPVHEEFLGQVGMLAYLAAQKCAVIEAYGPHGPVYAYDGVHGTVHVTLHVAQRPAGEATSDAPYGIAKVSAPVQ